MKPVPPVENIPNHKSGSPQTGEPVYLTIGKLRRTHGVKGEILMDILTDNPTAIIAGLTVFVGPRHKPQVITSIRPTDKNLLVSFEGFTDCDQAAVFRNQFVAIKSSDAEPLEEGKYYRHVVIGMDVIDENGIILGKVSDIISTGANDVYVIYPQIGEEILIPAIKSVVLMIDPSAGKMVVRLPEWD